MRLYQLSSQLRSDIARDHVGDASKSLESVTITPLVNHFVDVAS
jgi:hypothetical protein